MWLEYVCMYLYIIYLYSEDTETIAYAEQCRIISLFLGMTKLSKSRWESHGRKPI